MMISQKLNYGFNDEHFKKTKSINSDLNFLVKFYLIMETWLMINSVVTFLEANHYHDKFK